MFIWALPKRGGGFQTLAQIVCGSSLVNINHCWGTYFSSYLINIYHNFHQNTISESFFAIVTFKILISKVKIAVLRIFSISVKNTCHKVPGIARPGGSNRCLGNVQIYTVFLSVDGYLLVIWIFVLSVGINSPFSVSSSCSVKFPLFWFNVCDSFFGVSNYFLSFT